MILSLWDGRGLNNRTDNVVLDRVVFLNEENDVMSRTLALALILCAFNCLAQTNFISPGLFSATQIQLRELDGPRPARQASAVDREQPELTISTTNASLIHSQLFN